MNRKDICKNIGRRSFMISCACGFASFGLMWRFFNLQVLNGDEYSSLAYKNRVRIFLDNKVRGRILDCNGVEIATNRKFYNIICRPTEVKSKQVVLSILCEVLKLSEIEIQNFNHKFESKNDFIIKSIASWYDVSLLEFKSDQLLGININQEYKRFYPFGEMVSHIVGYNTYDAKSNLYIGQVGLEKLYDQQLQTKPDIIKKEVDARGVIKKELERKEISTVCDVTTSISAKLHGFIYSVIKDSSGSVCVIEIETGKIRAIVNSPSYNNNIFSQTLGSQIWNNLSNNQNMPLLNRALSSIFQPGSTLKPVVALAILEKEVINEHTTINCKGTIKIGDRIFRCWNKHGHGNINIKEAISQSCNIYFYTIGLRFKIDDLVSTAEKFGLGQQVFTGLSEEKHGVLPDYFWRMKNSQGRWYVGDTINTMIGHGRVVVTPIQLAVMVSRLASGMNILPTFNEESTQSFNKIDVQEKNLKIIQFAMSDAINSRFGTSRKFASNIQQIAGKTGTAQILNTENKYLSAKADHALFVGYSTFQSPKYAISVVLENAGTGGNAAKVAVRVLDYLHQILKIPDALKN